MGRDPNKSHEGSKYESRQEIQTWVAYFLMLPLLVCVCQ